MKTTNITKFFVGAGILALTATSCSNDIDVTPDVNPGEGRTAFMRINLHDVNSGTRAGEEFDDNNYQDGDKNEYLIDNARFFFFDEDGVFVCESSVWNNGSMVEDDKNITLEGNTVVVLENLNSKAHPAYMLTVLNGDGFTPSTTLEATAQSLCQYNVASDGRFVMSTASYYETAEDPNHDNKYYYATKLVDDNFGEGTPSTDSDVTKLAPVDVYIERLAGKVELLLGDLENDKIEVDGRTLYKINATVSGNSNDEGSNEEGVTQLYIEILGWDLSGTAPDSYLSKQFADEFSVENDNPWKNWNKPSDHRSFWAKSVGYGETDYPLNYKTYAGVNGNPKVRYANEYAAVPQLYNVDGQVLSSELTHVILKTRICDEKGNDLDLVRGSNGVLYKKDSYLNFILNSARIQNKLNMWYVTSETSSTETITLPNGDKKIIYSSSTKFAQVNADMVEIVKAVGTGMIKVVSKDINNMTDDSGNKLKWAVANNDGTFSPMAEDFDAESYLNGLLASVVGNTGGAMAYTGGASYYVIPIKHNTFVGNSQTENGFTYNLGYYGFIRNHWYQITVNKIEKVGYGIYEPGTGEEGDEGEKIIPNFPEDPAYYVTTNLKVLAWKIVGQSIDL